MLPLTLLSLPLFASLATADSLTTDNSTSWWTSRGVAPVQTFYSSSLQPPEFNRIVYDESKVSEGYTMLSYRGTGVEQAAPVIMDNDGSLIWSGYEAGFTNSMDLRVQQYKEEDVLTFFQGDFFSGGYANGSWYILSNNYTHIRSVSSLNETENTSDFHEIVITDNNTALVESWLLAEADLTSAGGSGTGWTWTCRFQEIDISGNSADNDKLLFQWDSIAAGIEPGESYFTVSDNAGNSSDNPFDSCHINTVNKFDNGNYLISLRGPSALYYISGENGDILWRLGGKYTNFTMGTNATFWYQHDARLCPGDSIDNTTFRLSIFDNAAGGGAPAETMARAIVLELDTEAWTAELVYEAIPSFGTPAASQGSHRIDEQGRHVVGWGATPFFSEYDDDENLIQDVAFGTTASVIQSYRVFKQSWSGYPLTTPSLAVNGSSAYASWNGATDVASWTLMGGADESAATSVIGNATKSGFETAIGLSGTENFLAVAALASDGTCLGVSSVYSTSSMAITSTNGTCPSGSSVAPAGTNGTSTASGSSSSHSSGSGKLSTSGVTAILFAAVVVSSAML
ncbi:hypothetical protein JCM11641_004965 [Rhodosporidiobolus odoratus]